MLKFWCKRLLFMTSTNFLSSFTNFSISLLPLCSFSSFFQNGLSLSLPLSFTFITFTKNYQHPFLPFCFSWGTIWWRFYNTSFFMVNYALLLTPPLLESRICTVCIYFLFFVNKLYLKQFCSNSVSNSQKYSNWKLFPRIWYPQNRKNLS